MGQHSAETWKMLVSSRNVAGIRCTDDFVHFLRPLAKKPCLTNQQKQEMNYQIIIFRIKCFQPNICLWNKWMYDNFFSFWQFIKYLYCWNLWKYIMQIFEKWIRNNNQHFLHIWEDNICYLSTSFSFCIMPKTEGGAIYGLPVKGD